MKRPLPTVSFIAVTAIILSVASAAAQGVTLRYRWNKGETLTYRMTILTSSVITGLPSLAEMKVDQTMTQVMTMAVEDVAADGTSTVRQTFTSVKMEMNGPMGHIEYDTAAPASGGNPMVQPLRQVLGQMVGESVTVVQAPDGTVRKVEGASRLVDKILKSLPDDSSAQAAAQSLKSVLSDEALKSTLEQSFSRLPAADVKAGDTWDGEISMGNAVAGRIGGTVKFTLKAVEGTPESGIARIGVALALQQTTAGPPGPNGIVVKLGDARGAGEMLFDVAKGRIQKSTMKTDLPSTMTGKSPDGTAATMQNKTTTTMTMELVAK